MTILLLIPLLILSTVQLGEINSNLVYTPTVSPAIIQRWNPEAWIFPDDPPPDDDPEPTDDDTQPNTLVVLIPPEENPGGGINLPSNNRMPIPQTSPSIPDTVFINPPSNDPMPIPETTTPEWLPNLISWDPTDPTDPTNPTDPIDPSNPPDPTDPDWPDRPTPNPEAYDPTDPQNWPTPPPDSDPEPGPDDDNQLVHPDLNRLIIDDRDRPQVPQLDPSALIVRPVLMSSQTEEQILSHEEIAKRRMSKEDQWRVPAHSGDGTSTEVIFSGKWEDSPLKDKIKQPAQTKDTIPKADLNTISQNPMPWLPQAKLATPGPTSVVMNAGIIVIYQITFYNDCPRNPLYMHIHVWDHFLIWDPEGQQIYPTAGTWASPICHLVKIPPKCGCNKLWVVLYNWNNPSYYSFWYELYQSQIDCYSCPENPQDGYYNRTTCKCDCSYECNNCATFSKVWVGYPACGCRCRISQLCLPPRYFNKRTCRCECQPICCSSGYYQHPTTCQCVPRYQKVEVPLIGNNP